MPLVRIVVSCDTALDLEISKWQSLATATNCILTQSLLAYSAFKVIVFYFYNLFQFLSFGSLLVFWVTLLIIWRFSSCFWGF